MLAKADEAVMKFLHRETEKMTQEYGHEEILLRARQVALLHTFIHIHTYIHICWYILHIYMCSTTIKMLQCLLYLYIIILTYLHVCMYVIMYVCMYVCM